MVHLSQKKQILKTDYSLLKTQTKINVEGQCLKLENLILFEFIEWSPFFRWLSVFKFVHFVIISIIILASYLSYWQHLLHLQLLVVFFALQIPLFLSNLRLLLHFWALKRHSIWQVKSTFPAIISRLFPLKTNLLLSIIIFAYLRIKFESLQLHLDWVGLSELSILNLECTFSFYSRILHRWEVRNLSLKMVALLLSIVSFTGHYGRLLCRLREWAHWCQFQRMSSMIQI